MAPREDVASIAARVLRADPGVEPEAAPETHAPGAPAPPPETAEAPAPARPKRKRTPRRR
jgi:hypothetical protein